MVFLVILDVACCCLLSFLLYMFMWLSLVMSLMLFFVLSLFPRDVLDEILDLIESVSEGFPTYLWKQMNEN